MFGDWTYQIGFSDIQSKSLESCLCMASEVFCFFAYLFHWRLERSCFSNLIQPGNGAMLICVWL